MTARRPVWDLRALKAADLITDERAAAAGLTGLHRGLAAARALDDDGYGQLVRGGLDRLSERLGTTRSAMSIANAGTSYS